MYLTKIQLDMTRRDTMRAMAAPSLFHGAVESSFPGERKRRLWRIDALGGKSWLMLVSEELPELSSVAEQFGYPDSGWETRDYAPLLKRIEQGSRWQFRLTANPTVSSPAVGQDGQLKRGKVYAHVTVAQQEKWLESRAEKHGFALVPGEFAVVNNKSFRFAKGGDKMRPVTLQSVTFEGLLTVTDPDEFRRTLTAGIGRGKAYGMGMLTVVRSAVRGNE